MKKKMWMMLAVLFLTTVGCSNGDKLVSFHNEELSKELKKEGIEPKLPTQFPMAVEGFEIQLPPHESPIYPVVFNGENGEVFNLRIHDGDVTYHGEFESEMVKVNGNDALYTDHEVTGLDLSWEEGDFYYMLNYQTTGLDTNVTKETMIKIAESFN